MPPDERALEVDAWLSRARSDLRAARVLLAADPPLPGVAAFHCQQCVEKSLKALLTHHDHAFRKTHDIGELAAASLTYRPHLEGLLRRAAPLTEYAWRFRCPGEVFEPPIDEIHAAASIAAEIMATVVSHLETSGS